MKTINHEINQILCYNVHDLVKKCSKIFHIWSIGFLRFEISCGTIQINFASEYME